MIEQTQAAELDRLITGDRLSQAIYVAAALGIADRLAAGPRRADDLASEIGAHDRSLYRLLRALAAPASSLKTGKGVLRSRPWPNCCAAMFRAHGEHRSR